MSSIPEELLLADVLPRLALSTLARFRCVSKSWRAQIDKPCFIKSHINQTQYTESTDIRIMFTTRSSPKGEDMKLHYFDVQTSMINDESLEPKEIDLGCVMKINKSPEKVYGIVGSCNGLVCILISNPPKDRAYNRMNPLTQKSWCLPHFSNEYAWCLYSSSCGFGYAENTDDYKVVVTGITTQGDSHTLIYNLKSNSWRRGGEDIPFTKGTRYGMCFDAGGVFAGHGLHWVVAMLDHQGQPTGFHIISFDLWEEKYGYIPWPIGVPTNFKRGQLNPVGCIKGCLSVSYYNNQNSSLDLWVMKEYGLHESWTKSSFRMDLDLDREYAVFHCQTPLAYLEESQKMVIQVDRHGFVLYDMRTQMSKLFRLPPSMPAVDTNACYGSLLLSSIPWCQLQLATRSSFHLHYLISSFSKAPTI